MTATRLCIDHLRRRRLGVEVDGTHASTDASPSDTSLPEATLAARQTLARLAGHLSDADLAILIMSRCDCMTQEEIAIVLDTSGRQVRRMLVKADEKLAAFVAGIG